jgi:hypothetical protein
MSSVPGQLTSLKLTQRVVPARVRGCPPDALVDPSWLGSPVEPARPGTRRFLTDLSLPIHGQNSHMFFKKAAYVDVGTVSGTPDGCAVEISWQSSSLAPLFPVFAGRLVVAGSEVTLEGLYAPPGGQFGVVLDRALLNIAARGTGRWFLTRVVEALAAEATPQPATARQPATPRQPPPARQSAPGQPAPREEGSAL